MDVLNIGHLGMSSILSWDNWGEADMGKAPCLPPFTWGDLLLWASVKMQSDDLLCSWHTMGMQLLWVGPAPSFHSANDWALEMSWRESKNSHIHLAGSQHEELCPWQRSWGRRLGIRKGGIEPQESPWKFSSIYPQNQSLPTLLLCGLTYTSDFTGSVPHHLSLKKS